MIAYHFHPDLAIGAQRTNKYAKYLPQYGWQPYVLSVNPKKYGQQDNSPAEFDCPTYRVSQWPVPDDIYIKFRNLLKKKRTSDQPKAIESPQSARSTTKSERSFIKRLAYTISTTPDQAMGWFVPAVIAARRIIRENKIDLIYSSGPPQTCHLAGFVVSKLTGMPLVLDFRDPWFYEKRHYHNGLPITKSFDRYFEKKVVLHASLVITTCNEWRDELKKTYRPLLDNNCHAIVNGFDQDEFNNTQMTSKKNANSKVTFLHAGSLYSGRDPKSLLQALGELLKDKQLSPNEIHMDFFGNIEMDMTQNKKIISDYQLSEVVSFHRPVARSSYLELLAGSNVLIMFQSNEARVNIPGKAFEYLAAGNDILCLTSEGATKNFMSAYENVAIAPLDDTGQIKEAILKLVKRTKSEKDGNIKPVDLRSITKKHLAGQFAELLTNLIKD